MAFHVEVNFSGFPFVAELGQQRADQAQERGFIGKEAGEPGAASEFLVDPFQCIGRAQSALMGGGQRKDGEALGQILFHPGGEFRRGGGVGGDDFFEPALRAGQIGRVEHAADGLSDRGALIQSGHVSLGVLLQMKLTALPGHRWEDGGARRAQARMVVADDQVHAVQAALLQAGEEGAPVDFGFAEGRADTQDGAFAVGPDAQGDEHGAIEDPTALADLFIAGVEQHVGIKSQRSSAPGFQFGVELSGALTDLRGTDGGAAELFDDGGDFAGGDALDVHLGQGEFERLLTAHAFVEGAGIEAHPAADLWDSEGDRAEARIESFGFEAVGVARAGIGAFIGLGLESLSTFLDHGFVDEQTNAFGQAASALFSDELQDGVQEFRLGLVGHLVFCVGCVC